jgi:hypothetical protein
VEEMLIQHLLTERLFRKVFNNPDFVRQMLATSTLFAIIIVPTVIYRIGNVIFFIRRFLMSIPRKAASVAAINPEESYACI